MTTATLTEISGQPMLVVDGWTVIITGTKETGIGMRVLAPNGRAIERHNTYAVQDRDEVGVASIGVTCVPQQRRQVLAVDLDEPDLVLGRGREEYMEIREERLWGKTKVWKQTLHRSSCRFVKSRVPDALTEEVKASIVKHGFEPFSKYGYSCSHFTYAGCQTCGTAKVELVEGT